MVPDTLYGFWCLCASRTIGVSDMCVGPTQVTPVTLPVLSVACATSIEVAKIAVASRALEPLPIFPLRPCRISQIVAFEYCFSRVSFLATRIKLEMERPSSNRTPGCGRPTRLLPASVE